MGFFPYRTLLIRVKRGAQDISLYAYTWRSREAMSASSLCQLHILSIYSSCLVHVFVVLKVQPSALKWNHRLYPIVVGS